MQADYVLNYDVVSMSKDHRLYVMARIKAKPAPDTNRRLPLNLSVVLDRSGSMAGDKLDYAKKAIEFLVQHISIQDQLSLVTYDRNVAVDFPPGSISNKDQFIQALRNIKAGTTTNLSGGWLQGCNLVASGELKAGHINRVLLLSDGLANEGVTDTPRLTQMASQKRAEGVTTSTMGVGMGFNEDLMTAMAVQGGGAFYFIDDPDQAPLIFAEELRGLLTVVAQNLNITLKPSDYVQEVRQLNMYATAMQGRNHLFQMGDLFGDEIKTLVMELHMPSLDDLGQIEVARLRFEYDEITEDDVTHRTLELPITVNSVPPEQFQPMEPNAEVVKQVLLLEATHARKEAMQHADGGDFASATGVLSKAADSILDSGIDDKELQAEHDALREEAINMEIGASRYDNRTRKTMSSSIAYTTTRKWESGKMATRSRLRRSRAAVERHDETPTTLMWGHETYTLTRDRVTIGRHSGNDIVIDEPDVSEVHCQIVRDGDSLYLEDMGSANGTFANGGEVKGRFRLSVGDVITVGSRMIMAR